MAANVNQTHEPSYTELIENLAIRAQDLIRSEYLILKAEAKENGGKLLSKSLVCLLCGVLFVMSIVPIYIAAILSLGALLEGRYALASLMVGVISALLSWLLLKSTMRSMAEEEFEFKQTKESLEEDVRIVKSKIEKLTNATVGV